MALCCNYDVMDIGETPAAEPCQQVGTKDYDPVKAKAECRRYIAHLRIKYGPEPEGAEFRIKPSQHDFGTCYGVVCRFDPNNKAAVDYAFKVEEGLERWLPDGPAE